MKVEGLVYFLCLFASISAIWPFDDDETTSGGSATETTKSSSETGSFFGGIESALGIDGGSSSTSDGRNPYEPYETACPSGPLVRDATELSKEETEYISNRQVITNKNLIDFLSNKANLSDFDAESFINKSPKNISLGITFSGGGYRAMLCGAGQMLGLDSRFDDANNKGLGGLLQASTYLVGLSGGNWLVGSVVLNDFASIADILSGDLDIWDLDHSIFNPGGSNVFSTSSYYYDIYDAVSAKDDAGFDVTVTDVWGRALSGQFFNSSTEKSSGENITWGSIRNLSSFQSFEMPYPIVIANGRTPNTMIINENSTIFEVSPYELGSWDPSLRSFTKVEYIGSFVDNGTNSSQKCYANFDNAGYIMGTSSSLFNAIVFNLPSSLPSAIQSIFKSILDKVSSTEIDIASYYPNPFSQTDWGSVKTISSNDTLYLCDGGEDGQNVPFYPLIQNLRNVDVIMAFDNSADTEQDWPNGTSIIDTYQRQYTPQGKGSPFPYVPDVSSMLKLTAQPVFFGCDASNMTSLIDFHGDSNLNETDIPLVIQMWNNEHSYSSNTSTFKMSYDPKEMSGMIRNGFESSTRNNLTDDSDWAKCVGCALIRRTQERLGEDQSDECRTCFAKYCWVGTEKDAAPHQPTSTGASAQSQSTSTGSGSSSSGSSSSTSSSKKKGDSVKNTFSTGLAGTVASVLLMLVF